MKAGAGYHDPGKYGSEEEGTEGLLADEDVTGIIGTLCPGELSDLHI